jgi:ribosomal protein S18 acetylase RimI-like enzyme
VIESDKNNKYIVRNYHDDDYDQIAHLWEITNLGSPKRGDNKQTIEDSIQLGGALLILEEKNSGIVCGTSWMTFDGRRTYLHHFGILPEYQGKGLSNNLMKASLKYAKEKGYQVKLEVHKSNFKAINLYLKSGFRYLSDYDVYIIRDISKI